MVIEKEGICKRSCPGVKDPSLRSRMTKAICHPKRNEGSSTCDCKRLRPDAKDHYCDQDAN